MRGVVRGALSSLGLGFGTGPEPVLGACLSIGRGMKTGLKGKRLLATYHLRLKIHS